DVGGAHEFHQLAGRNEAVVKDDALLHAQLLRQTLEVESIRLALPAQDVRMRRSQDDVDHVGTLGQHLRKRLDDVLDSLARGKQSEGQEDHPALHAELILEVIGIYERNIGNTVGDHVDAMSGNPVDFLQERRASAAHGYQPVGEIGKLRHDLPLGGIGRLED